MKFNSAPLTTALVWAGVCARIDINDEAKTIFIQLRHQFFYVNCHIPSLIESAHTFISSNAISLEVLSAADLLTLWRTVPVQPEADRDHLEFIGI